MTQGEVCAWSRGSGAARAPSWLYHQISPWLLNGSGRICCFLEVSGVTKDRETGLRAMLWWLDCRSPPWTLSCGPHWPGPRFLDQTAYRHDTTIDRQTVTSPLLRPAPIELRAISVEQVLLPLSQSFFLSLSFVRIFSSLVVLENTYRGRQRVNEGRDHPGIPAHVAQVQPCQKPRNTIQAATTPTRRQTRAQPKVELTALISNIHKDQMAFAVPASAMT